MTSLKLDAFDLMSNMAAWLHGCMAAWLHGYMSGGSVVLALPLHKSKYNVHEINRQSDH